MWLRIRALCWWEGIGLYKIRLDWYAIKSLKASQTPPIANERLQTMLDKYTDVF